MKVKFYGVRGSTPICDSSFQQFGGNTSCVTIEVGDELFIIDAGTGIRKLGKELIQNRQKKIQVLFTHFHWDHIQGLPFFEPCYNSDSQVDLYTHNDEVATLELALKTQMYECYFPIRFSQMKADFGFRALDHPFISTIRLNHPGGCVGFKFQFNNQSIVYLVDHEHQEPLQQQYLDFCDGADLLVHDAQYTSEEYIKYVEWGHSNYSQALELAKRSNVRRLILTHHDPEHDDSFLLKQEQECKSVFENCVLAREQMEVSI